MRHLHLAVVHHLFSFGDEIDGLLDGIAGELIATCSCEIRTRSMDRSLTLTKSTALLTRASTAEGSAIPAAAAVRRLEIPPRCSRLSSNVCVCKEQRRFVANPHRETQGPAPVSRWAMTRLNDSMTIGRCNRCTTGLLHKRYTSPIKTKDRGAKE